MGEKIEQANFYQFECVVFIKMYLCTLCIGFVGKVPSAFGQVTFLATCPTGQVGKKIQCQTLTSLGLFNCQLKLHLFQTAFEVSDN